MSKIKSKNSKYPTLILPATLSFKNANFIDFDSYLSLFDWSFDKEALFIDGGYCTNANYQSLSLLILYIWHLKRKNTYVKLRFSKHKNQKYPCNSGLKNMWTKIGGVGCFNVLNSSEENFRFRFDKPLFAIRNPSKDIPKALNTILEYSKSIDFSLIEGHENTLRYIMAELLYNSTEHGYNSEIPAILQFNWYRDKKQLSFILADLGVGIKTHLEKSYPPFSSDIEALEFAIKPEVSGTFSNNTPYRIQNNAGMGLYLSSNIGRKLEADMYIVSGNGLLHISPTDVTSSHLRAKWPGTFIYMTIGFDKFKSFKLSKELDNLRQKAQLEIEQRTKTLPKEDFNVDMYNYFGNHCEVKHEAIKFRDTKLIPALRAGKTIILDFSNVKIATHSFLVALLGSSIQDLGLSAFKRIKRKGESDAIRSILEFIFDKYTS